VGILDFLPIKKDEQKWPIEVEITEYRAGGSRKTYRSRGRRIFKQPANVSVYQVKGVKREIIAPSFKHLEILESGGELLRLVSPDPDDYFVLTQVDDEHVEKNDKGEEIVVKTSKLLPVLDEDTKAWVDWNIEKSHQTWKKENTLEKILPFLLILIAGIVTIAGVKFATDASIESAASAEKAAQSFQVASEHIGKASIILQETGLIFERIYGDDGLNLPPPTPPQPRPSSEMDPGAPGSPARRHTGSWSRSRPATARPGTPRSLGYSGPAPTARPARPSACALPDPTVTRRLPAPAAAAAAHGLGAAADRSKSTSATVTAS